MGFRVEGFRVWGLGYLWVAWGSLLRHACKESRNTASTDTQNLISKVYDCLELGVISSLLQDLVPMHCDVLRQDEEQEEEDEEEDEEETGALIVMRLSLTSLLLPVILFRDSEL